MKLYFILFTCIFSFALRACTDDLISQGDEWYSKRADNFDSLTLTVDPVPVNKAFEFYLRSFETMTGPDKEEACWKLMRCCFFKGQYVLAESELKKEMYEIGKKTGAEGLEMFPESVAVHTWMAIIWGVWGEEYGIFRSAREGVAGKISNHCEKVIELDESFQDAAGYRVLGRLHFKAPRIPIILGWPSKEKSLEYLEKANQIAPNNLFTRKYLAEILYERGNTRRAQELLHEIIETTDSKQGMVEYTFIKKESQSILDQWENE